MKGLSKSRYTAFCQCPKNLWLKVYKPEEATVDAGVEARFAQGNVVGDLAMGLFGDFKEAHAEKADGSLNLTKMVEQTRQWMDEGVENICEASFICEGGYCAVDILRKTAGGWAIYEVKSTSFPEFNGQEAKLEKYAPDIAYQKWVLEQCGVNVTGTYLVCLNSDYVRQGELDIEQLFVVNDMKEMVENESLKVPARVSQAMKVINSEQEPDTELSECCMKPYGCAFWEYCKRQHGVPSPSVFDIYGGKGKGGFTFKKKLDCYHQGLIAFEDLRSSDIGPIQNMQIEAALTGREFINSEGIRKFLNKLSYPLYFLDFETMQDAVPQYDGAKVYAQITFQYSLHIKEKESTTKVVELENKGRKLKLHKIANYITHKEYLAPSDGSDPRRALAEQLCRDIPMDVCTLAYNKMFECGRIRELAALYPDLAPHLLNIADNIKDLIDPFRAGDYYVPAMGGSFSIKSVLPALFPNDSELDYHNLDERCQNGGDAMTIFPRIKDMEPEEAKASRQALLDYCKLDTWAMVKVWEKLKNVIDLKNEQLMSVLLNVTKHFFCSGKNPVIGEYHLNHHFNYYYISIRDKKWQRGVDFGWYPLGMKKLKEGRQLTLYFNFGGKRLDSTIEDKLPKGFSYHEKSKTYRTAIDVPDAQSFLGLNEESQKLFLETAYNEYVIPVIKNVLPRIV